MKKHLPWLMVVAMTCAVFAPVLRYGWAITWDDAILFWGNPYLKEFNWRLLFTTKYTGHFMPLMWLSAMGTYAVGGLNPAVWHGVNAGLHTISAVLLYFIARRLVGSTWGAVFAALVWAVHPLRMESVAWISERKDVLMGVFFLAATLLWMQGRRWWSFAAFVAACASKSPAVVLPAMLLAYEWYRASGFPWRYEAKRLAPFFAVSAIFTATAFWGLHTVLASMTWANLPLGPRLLQAAYSEMFYLVQTVYPARLSALIEYTWMPSWSQPEYPLAVGACLVGAVLLLLTRRRWPALTACAVAYTVAVLPQSGLFQNGQQLVANRYSYLASLPLALLAGGAFTIASRRMPRTALAGVAVALIALSAVTLHALPMWQDGDTMWQYAALHEPTCTFCQDVATGADLRHGDLEAAIVKQRRAIAVSDTTMVPRWERHFNLAALLFATGKPDEAAHELRTYLEVVPPQVRDSAPDRDYILRAQTALASLGQ